MTPRLTHFAINTDDVEATQSFYGSVFGWQFQEYGPAGGRILMDKFTIANVGHLIAFQDPGGNPALAMEYDSSAG